MSACYKLLPKNLINYLWKCSIYALNKILSVFDCCWSVFPVTSGLLFSLILCLFHWKTFYKKRLPHFPVFGNIKKIGQRQTISSQWKTLTKISLIFYRLFSKKKNIGKQSLFCAMHNSYSSLTSSLPFTFSLFSHPHCHSFWSLLFLQISPYLSLSSFFSRFLFPFVTQFSEFWVIFSFFSKLFLAWWIPIWTIAEIHSFSHIKVPKKKKGKKNQKEWMK